MADENITPEKVEMLEGAFLDARLALILERLAKSDCTLGNFSETLADLLKEYAIGAEGLDVIKKSADFENPAPDARFLHACVAALMLESQRLMQFVPDAVEAINRAALLQSAEQRYNAILDEDILASTAAQRGISIQQLREVAQQQVKDPDSQLWRDFVREMSNPDPDFSYLRGDRTRGVFQYCDETDYEYACSMLMRDDMDEEAPVFDQLAKSYENMEKDDLTDGYIESMCTILPKLYMYSDELVGLHTDPDKAVEIYENALEARPSTAPAVPRFTKDVFPGTIKTSEQLSAEKAASDEAARKAEEEAAKARAEFAEKIKKYDMPRLIVLLASAVLFFLTLTVLSALRVLPVMLVLFVVNAVNSYLYTRSKGIKHPLTIASLVVTALYLLAR